MLGGNPTPDAPAETSLLYAGEHFDTDSQHYYNRARWYDPLNGRFNRVDDFAGSNHDPQSLHKYLYAHCNPINNIDPSGQSIFTLQDVLSAVKISSFFGAITGSVVGGIHSGLKGALYGMLTGAVIAPLMTLAVMFGGAYIIAPLLSVKAATGIFITHTAVTAIFSALGIRQYMRAQSGRAKAAIMVAVVVMVAFWGIAAYRFSRASLPARLPQDKNVDPKPPKVKPLNRSIGESPTQNARLQEDIATLKKMGARAMRVNQQQVNVNNIRVGKNIPDYQFTLNQKRFYLEYETSTSNRGPAHAVRIQANDPKGTVIIIEQD